MNIVQNIYIVKKDHSVFNLSLSENYINRLGEITSA